MKLSVVVLIGVLLPSLAQAATYWTAPNGTHNVTGLEAFCATIRGTTDPGVRGTIRAAAFCMKVAGDVMNIKGTLGPYTGDNHRISTGNNCVGCIASGTSEGTRTIIQGAPGEPRPQINIALWFGMYEPVGNERNYITIRNLNVDGSECAVSDGFCGGGGDILFEGHHNRLENVIMTNAWNAAVFCRHQLNTTTSHHFEMVNNTISGYGRDGFGYALYSSCEDTLVEGNDISGRGGGIQVHDDNAGVIIPRPILRNNYIHNIAPGNQSGLSGVCVGIGAIDGPDAQIYNNVLDGTACNALAGAHSGISVGYNPGGAHNAQIYNNTLYNWSSDGIQIGIFGAANNALVKNNIIVGSVNPIIVYSGTGLVTDRNACTSATNCGTNAVVISDLLACVTSTTNFALHVLPNPCVDAGATISLVLTDKTGAVRPQGSGYDIGAYELTVVVVTAPHGRTVYIDGLLPNGTDCAGGAGTSYRTFNRDCAGSDGTQAWNNIYEGFRVMNVVGGVGTLVYVRAGTYPIPFPYGNVATDTWGCVPACPTSWANANRMTNYPGESVVMQHQGLVFNASVSTGGVGYLIIEGETRARFIMEPQTVGGQYLGLTFIGTAHHVRFQRTTLRNFGESGIRSPSCTVRPTFVELLDNLITGNGDGSTVSGTLKVFEHGMHLNCAEDWLIADNNLTGNQATGVFAIASTFGNIQRLTIERNTIEGRKAPDIDGESACLVVSGGGGSIIRRNLCLGQGAQVGKHTFGIQVGIPGTSVTTAQVYHNTITDVRTDGLQVNTGATDTDLKNNLLNLTPNPIYNLGTNTTGARNLCPIVDNDVAGACAVIAPTPGFTTPGSIYTLAAGSPAIDAGQILGAPYTFSGLGPDIGYAEVTSDGTPPGVPAGFVVQ